MGSAQQLLAVESQVADFLRRSEGDWRSERRYYTLPECKAQEMVSLMHIRFLSRGDAQLVELAELHGLEDPSAIVCGAQVTWQTSAVATGREQSTGSTLFGVRGEHLLRDGGFAVRGPVLADYAMRDADTLYLRTEFGGSVFEEELKLVGERYRTRQTIISRAGQQQLIGQYLEHRLSEA
jgi:hypothetical protein